VKTKIDRRRASAASRIAGHVNPRRPGTWPRRDEAP
jgi:hypothetical protein